MNLPWELIGALSVTGVAMALISSLVGMRQKVEIPLWWVLYAVWVVIVLLAGTTAPFVTILFSSVLAGLLHGITQALLIDQYKKNNPWYAEQLRDPRPRMATRFLTMGFLVGTTFGTLAGGIAWVLSRVVR